MNKTRKPSTRTSHRDRGPQILLKEGRRRMVGVQRLVIRVSEKSVEGGCWLELLALCANGDRHRIAVGNDPRRDAATASTSVLRKGEKPPRNLEDEDW